MKILFINSYLSFPRYIKRIKAIQQLGVNTTVIAYNRDDNKSGELLSDTISLGTIEHGKYFQRMLTIIKSFFGSIQRDVPVKPKWPYVCLEK